MLMVSEQHDTTKTSDIQENSSSKPKIVKSFNQNERQPNSSLEEIVMAYEKRSSEVWMESLKC